MFFAFFVGHVQFGWDVECLASVDTVGDGRIGLGFGRVGDVSEVFVDWVFDRDTAQGCLCVVGHRIDIPHDRAGDDFGRLDPLFDLFDLPFFGLDLFDDQLVGCRGDCHGGLGRFGVGRCDR